MKNIQKINLEKMILIIGKKIGENHLIMRGPDIMSISMNIIIIQTIPMMIVILIGKIIHIKKIININLRVDL